jgi:programmed cell death protein 5
MDELEALRKKRLAQIQQQAADQEAFQEERNAEYEDQKKNAMRAILTDDARERLGRIRVARPELAENLEQQLIMLAQSGRLKSKITDQQLREILGKLLPKKRDITIRKRGI